MTNKHGLEAMEPKPDAGEVRYFRGWDDGKFTEMPLFYSTIFKFTSSIVKGNVLDIGCGSRIYYNVDSVQSWAGLDLSQTLLDQLRFLGGNEPPKVQKLLHTCEDLPFPDETFDTVCAVFVLHHLAQQNRARSRQIVLAVLREARRVLKKGGHLLIAENPPRIPLRPYRAIFPVLYWLSRRLTGVELPYFWTSQELSEIAKEAGFPSVHYVDIPLREKMKLPVFGITIRPWLFNSVQKFSLYHFSSNR